MAERSQEGYLIEFRQIGQSVKVSAVDPVSKMEVSIVGAARAPRQQLIQTAIRKLEYVMKKNNNI
ncbi:MAG: hypothetical protein CMF31_08710 [Kordiimonas sp.]|nr:hypothetical protein [Kordiimonas sp.]|tara:strand:+ start:451 stop:645 length:195 start_codon:yes stop_codon:yes gene_type:complete